MDKLKDYRSNAEIRRVIGGLKDSLTGDMTKDMEIRDKIHNLEMKLNGVKPEHQNIDCINCGS